MNTFWFRHVSILNRIVRRSFTAKSTPIGKPVVFSESKASKWQSKYTKYGRTDNNQSDLKAWSAVISLTVFMVYFFILREENGIDEILGRNTQETFEDLQSRGLISQQDIHENSPYASFVKDDTAPIYGK